VNRIRPYAVFSDGCGNLYEDKSLFAAGRNGFTFEPLYLDQMIELPLGSDLFELPGRATLGYNKKNELTTSNKGIGTAAFCAPAHTQLHLAAYTTNEGAPVLPLYAYSPLAWHKGKFYTSAVRIDEDMRQDCRNFTQQDVIKRAGGIKNKYKDNRLVAHLVDHCALTYFCPAARNFVMGRFEAPIPTSPTCNANCIGCISFQPEKSSPISCSQHRLTFVPTVDEIISFAIFHLDNAKDAVVSFGQGCEGEPLLVWETIKEAIIEIRKKTKKGIINLNTNGSLPNAVDELCKAGLNSIRISMNSCRKELYLKYYRPNNYKFEDVLKSIEIARQHNIWSSLNYFVLPGITDQIEEYEALKKVLSDYKVSMIQWRNFNIDPEWIFTQMDIKPPLKTLGINQLLNQIKADFPELAYGYFNPTLSTMNKHNHTPIIK
jgi:MoaA/NifB/PqqE/SkfB family radical SAM enzyme